MSQQELDVAILTEACQNLLTGKLKVDMGLLKLKGPLAREGRNRTWMAQGVARSLEENQELIPVVADVLSRAAAEKFIKVLQQKYPMPNNT